MSDNKGQDFSFVKLIDQIKHKSTQQHTSSNEPSKKLKFAPNLNNIQRGQGSL
jgi:hypothetical protein